MNIRHGEFWKNIERPIMQSSFLSFVAPSSVKYLYEKAEIKGRKFKNFVVKIVVVATFFIYTLVPVLDGVYNIAVGNLDTTKWYQFIQVE